MNKVHFLDKFFPNLHSLLLQGTFLEKANWIFQLYDKDGDGSISKDEMLSIIKSIHSMATMDIKGKQVMYLILKTFLNDAVTRLFPARLPQ